jgi:hypothetical protein
MALRVLNAAFLRCPPDPADVEALRQILPMTETYAPEELARIVMAVELARANIETDRSNQATLSCAVRR